jgi:hypothetical protein
VVIGLGRQRRTTEVHRWQKIPWPDQRRKLIEIDKRVRDAGGRRPRWSINTTGAGPVAQDLAAAGLLVARSSSRRSPKPASSRPWHGDPVGSSGREHNALSDEPVLLNELDILKYAMYAMSAAGNFAFRVVGSYEAKKDPS